MSSTKLTLPDKSVLEKLRKIASLAERGYKGEAENARRALDSMLKKYGITFESLLQEERKPREFRCSNRHEFRLFLNVLVHHFGSKSEVFTSGQYNKSARKIIIMLTDLEYADLAPEWDYYRTNLASEMRQTEDALLLAFISKFQLYDKTPKNSGTGGDETEQIDRDKLRRALGLIGSIKVPPFRKLLED